MSRLKESTEYIRQVFTPDERLKMGDELAQCHNRLADIESEESVIKAQFKERKTQVEQTVSSLSRKLANGFEMVNIKCRMEYDKPNMNEVSYVRIDNGEVVKVRAMLPDEMQEELPLGDGDGSVVVIPPSQAEASAERSTANIAEFFGKQDETATDQPGPIEASDPEEIVQDDELIPEEFIDEKGSPVDASAHEKSEPKDLAEHHAQQVEKDSNPTRKPRGFTKPTNESAW